jgi:hypothetical protein
MALFSERYGYIKPSEVLIRECMPEEIVNAINSAYDILQNVLFNLDRYNPSNECYKGMELFMWTRFLNKRRNDFFRGFDHEVVVTKIMSSADVPWHKKLDALELSVKWMSSVEDDYRGVEQIAIEFAKRINHEFERLNYAYRFIDKEIVELTNEQEIKAIEECLLTSANNVKMHLSNALELLAERPIGKYGNSIKESISAVEVVCRNKTGESTLGRALDCLVKKGIVIPQTLKSAFNKLYDYTNDKDTGIRHALMDETGDCAPTYAEALFMLVSCSAFINYLYAKEAI